MPSPRPSLAPLTADQQTLVSENLGLAYHWAGSFASDGEADRDAAVNGLIRAAQGFDPERGYKFSTYATYCIRSALHDALRQRMSERAHAAMLFSDLDCLHPHPKEAETIDWLAELGVCDPEPVDLSGLFAAARSLLNSRWWQVLRLRYLEGLSLRETGKRLTLSKERVRQIEKDALEKLREHLQEESYV